MTRALAILACLSALLLMPATAGARLHVVPLERGETVITYEGDGETNIPTGYQCVNITQCTSFGSVAYRLHWEASVIVNRLGTIHGGDARLQADGVISVQPNAGLPAGASLAKAPACLNSVRDRHQYEDGMSVTFTRRSVGVQAELPYRRRWLVVSGDPNMCQLGPDTWAGSVFSQGLDSAPPERSRGRRAPARAAAQDGRGQVGSADNQEVRLHLRKRHRNRPVRCLHEQDPIEHDDLQQLQAARHRRRSLPVVLRLSGPHRGCIYRGAVCSSLVDVAHTDLCGLNLLNGSALRTPGDARDDLDFRSDERKVWATRGERGGRYEAVSRSAGKARLTPRR